jgi:hypothetical protein
MTDPVYTEKDFLEAILWLEAENRRIDAELKSKYKFCSPGFDDKGRALPKDPK